MTDKKIISILLVLVILLTSFAPIVRATTSDIVTIEDSTLLQSLLDRYDDDRDGQLSKTEINNIRYLSIPEGTQSLSGLEYAENIEDITYNYNGTELDFSPINVEKITDLSVYNMAEEPVETGLNFLKEFTNLSDLTLGRFKEGQDYTAISSCNSIKNITFANSNITSIEFLSNNVNLKAITIRNTNSNTVPDLDISPLGNLTNLQTIEIRSYNIKNITTVENLTELTFMSFVMCTGITNQLKLENNQKLQTLNFYGSDISDISFAKNLPNLTSFSLDYTAITEAEKAELWKLNDFNAYIGEYFKITRQASMPSLCNISAWTCESDNESVVIFDSQSYGIAKTEGTANITMTLKEDPTVYKTMTVTVTGIDSNQESGESAGKSTLISGRYILNENGDLWKLHTSSDSVEKIDSNVQKYVYNYIYIGDEAFHYTLTKKYDGTVEFVFNGVKSVLEDATDIYGTYDTGYLAKDGTYYTMTENGTWEKLTDNVESIIDSYLVKKDGKTYTIKDNLLACDFKIVDAHYPYVVDENGAIWATYKNPIEQVGENFKEFLATDDEKYCTTDGKIMSFYSNEYEYEYLYKEQDLQGNTFFIDKENQLLLNDTVILTDVVYVARKSLYHQSHIDESSMLIVRGDGSVWELVLSGKAELVKFTQHEGNMYFVDENYNAEPKLRLETEALTGFDIKNLGVSQVLASSNLRSGYTAKAYKNEEELSGTDKISTGTVIKIYNEQGEEIEKYTALVYGDVTGRGNPGAADALAIVKNNLGEVIIEDQLMLEAGRMTENTRKTGGVPNSADALAIIKAKLDK